jgi:tetrahydromethanopterin S-methyltransferase subunit H
MFIDGLCEAHILIKLIFYLYHMLLSEKFKGKFDKSNGKDLLRNC